MGRGQNPAPYNEYEVSMKAIIKRIGDFLVERSGRYYNNSILLKMSDINKYSATVTKEHDTKILYSSSLEQLLEEISKYVNCPK